MVQEQPQWKENLTGAEKIQESTEKPHTEMRPDLKMSAEMSPDSESETSNASALISNESKETKDSSLSFLESLHTSLAAAQSCEQVL